MMPRVRSLLLGICAACALGTLAFAQQGVPNALQGFSQNRNEPVKIEASSLEVRDKDKVATFLGDVKVTQGDTTMTCKSLLVFYEQENKPGTMKAAEPGPGGQQAIKRLEARGGVVVTQKDQTATGDIGIFDMKANTITLSGNVVVAHGQNVLRGARLVVDMTTGAARVESGKGRVTGVFMPSSVEDGNDKAKQKEPEKRSAPQRGNAERGGQERSRPVSPRGIY
jgi:lipopolysaccharide export system protein LptA